MDLNNVACSAEVDAECRQKLINSFGHAKHLVKLFEIKNAYRLDVFGGLEALLSLENSI